MRREVAFWQLNHKNILFTSFFLHHAFFLIHVGQILGNPIQNEVKIDKNATLDQNQAPISNIPDTIVSLDNLKFKLQDVLEDLKDVADKNNNTQDALVEAKEPLTIDDVKDIENNGVNPINPEKTEPEEDAPMDIKDQLEFGKDESPPKDVSGRSVEEEVCGR